MRLILRELDNKFIFLSYSHTHAQNQSLAVSSESSDGCESHLRHRKGGITTGFSIIHLFAAEGIRGLSILIYPGCTCIKQSHVHTNIWRWLILGQKWDRRNGVFIFNFLKEGEITAHKASLNGDVFFSSNIWQEFD